MTRDEIETAAAEYVADANRAGFDRSGIVSTVRGDRTETARFAPPRFAADGIGPADVLFRANVERFAEWSETGIDPDRADGPDGPDPFGPYGPPFDRPQ